ncbi:MAG: ABC-2 type transport system permease protein [Phormidesmis priestleyi Ana]|uniref:Transport permease protein n=1 Tax=Phormidesmis priestleyi Ana TaxID=1666911 RepID=A0A0P7ZQ61_9CYAN|nr:MAG: ABC-2 type transport system permease protein [Phormidesmis priestleyi Ana]
MSTLQNAQDAWSQPDGTINEKAIAAVVAARQEGGWGRSLHDILTIARRNLLIEFRNPAEILVSTAFPISLFLVFTASFAKVVAPGESYSSYAQFLLPFTLVQGLIFGSVNVGSVFYNDLESGRDVRLRAMPIARLAAVGGRLVAAAVRILFQISGIVLVGHLVGFRFYSGLLSTIGFFLLPTVFVLSIALIAVYIAIGAQSSETILAVMNPWILPFTFLSIGYVPKEGFPDWAVGFVSHNPVSMVTQAMRALANGEPAAQSVIITLAWSLALVLLFGPLTLRAYKRKI